MTTPSQHEPLDEHERALARVLRALPGAEPSAAVDQRILRAAADAAASTRRPALRWLAVGSAGWGIGGAAAAVLALGVGWHLLDPTRNVPFERTAPTAHAESSDEAVTVTLGEPQARANDMAPAKPAAVPPPIQAPAMVAPAPARARVRPASPPPPAPPAPFVPDPVPAPAPAEAGVVGSLQADALAAPASAERERERPPEAPPVLMRNDAEAGAVAGQAKAQQQTRSETDSLMAPAAWLARVRELSEHGRPAEAADSLRRVHQHYPDHVIPADLLPLLRE